MKLGFAQCDSILNTLPIGYYANRRIGVALDQEAETSSYSPMDDAIRISYPSIAERAAQLPEDANVEEAVRSMLYHEVSHAILTPQILTSPSAQLNIFEDERIESLLADYYMDVDFKKQVQDLCGNSGAPTNALQAFFNAVRLGAGPEEAQEAINRLIKKHSGINRQTEYYDARHYAHEVQELYEKIAQMYKMNPDDFTPPPMDGQEGEGEKGNSQNQNGKGKKKRTSMDSIDNPEQQEGNGNGSGDGDGEESEGEGEGEGNGDNDGNADGEGNGEGEEGKESQGNGHGKPGHGRGVALNPKTIKDVIDHAFDINTNLNETQRQELSDFQKTAEMIISNFNKKNSGGSGVNAYSGVFNPRLVGRQDYRYFDRSMTTQGNNRFGTCHLNLFIDCSGSFHSSQDIVNGILAVLSEIERKNRNFSLDVSFLNDDYRDCATPAERSFEATGGNDVPNDMKERFLKRQLPNTCNYNIVLFDGDAFSDCYASFDEKTRRFSAFDYKQTTLITDDDNEQYMGSGFKSSKVVVTSHYTKELISHLIKALTVAFG